MPRSATDEAIPPEASRGPVPVPALSPSLTRNQIRGFWASWGGWTLDGMDSFVYALVLVPSLRELLPRSGIAATKANIGHYGGLLFALFLMGWGLAFLWGPIGDKFGRVRTLMLTIVWYSVFTFLSAFVTSVWQLAILRLFAGIGIGGEWAMGGTFVAEEWPEQRRRMGAGLMHTGYYVGIFLAALANYGIGSHYGWRAMFIVGGVPALLLAWIRHGVVEPAAWKKKESVVRSWAVWRPFATLFSPAWRRRTILNALFMLASICGSVGGNCLCSRCYYRACRGGWTCRSASCAVGFLGSHAGFVRYHSGLPGDAMAGRTIGPPRGARRVLRSHDGLHCADLRQSLLSRGRVRCHGFSFVCFSWGWVAPTSPSTLCGCRSNIPRSVAPAPSLFPLRLPGLVAPASLFWSDASVRHFGSLGTPVAMTAIAFALDCCLIPFGAETRGKHLPS